MDWSCKCSTAIIFCFAFNVVHSSGELVILQHPATNNSTSRKLTCISEDDDSALIWNDVLSENHNKFQPEKPMPKNVTECAIWNSTLCFIGWANARDWYVVHSAVQPMGPVLDYRWEGFEQFRSDGNHRSQKYQYVKKIAVDPGTVVFSVRGEEVIPIILCQNENLSGGPCIEIKIQMSKGSQSTIRNCIDGAPRFHHSSETGSCIDVTSLSHHFQDEYHWYKWYTFRMEWNSGTRMIQVFKNTENEAFLKGYIDQWNPVSHVAVSGHSSLQFRFHFYEYLRTNISKSELYTEEFNFRDEQFCVELLVGLCPKCELKIDLLDRYYKRIAGESISGDEKFVNDGLPLWRSISLPATSPVLESVRLRIRTILNEGKGNGMWAVDNFRMCKSVGGLRESTITITGFNSGEVTEWHPISCQKLSFSESAVVRTDVRSLILPDTRRSEQLIRKWVNSCGSSCTSFHGKGWSVCTQDGCTCNRGFMGRSCSEDCLAGAHGYNCNKTCGSCYKNNCEKTCGHCVTGCDDQRLLPPFCKKELLGKPTVLRGSDDHTVTVLQHVELDTDAEINVYLVNKESDEEYVRMTPARAKGPSAYEVNMSNLKPYESYTVNTMVFVACMRESLPFSIESQEINFTTTSLGKITNNNGELKYQNLVWLAILPVVAACMLVICVWHRNCRRVPKPPRRPSYLEIIPLSPTETPENNSPIFFHPTIAIPRTIEGGNRPSAPLYAVPNEADSCIISVEYFEEYTRKAVASGLLRSQFMLLPKGLTRSCYYGRLPTNIPKNRTSDLVPYDDNRVVLGKVFGDRYSDYINASYIRGHKKERAYIATQEPKPNTVNDFWRMIWQEDVRVICMLTNVVEGTETEFEKYWPDVDTPLKYGDLTISNMDNKVFADYSSRRLELRYHQDTRTVTHFLYTSWPILGVPTNHQSLIAFLKKLRRTLTGNGPIVVHCSTGDDRTGTIILCDICLHQAVTEKEINVTAVITRMRNSRANMVGTLQQYVLAHIIITESLVSLHPTQILCSEMLPKRMKKMRMQLPSDIQRLNDTAWQDQALRFLDMPRPPDSLPELSPESPEPIYFNLFESKSGQFYAESIDGFKAKKEYLASWLPPRYMISDFWKYLTARNIKLIVILQCSDPRNPTCRDIFPDESMVGPMPYIEVENQTTLNEEKYFTNQKLLLTNTSEENAATQFVTVLICRGWGRGKNDNLPTAAALVSLWIAAEKISRKEGQTLVLCQDGVTGCGLYLAMSFLLERMAVEGECDVISAVRAVRRSNPKFVQSLKQFKFLYNAAVNYGEYFQAYANFS